MLRFPNCKINLGLYITGRRDDGYHNLETVFYPVGLKDALEIVPAKGQPEMHLSGKMIAGNGGSNLVWKAYELMKGRFPGKIPELDIYLHKVIPMGAGLGGGSSDGAFMLRMISDDAQQGLDDEQLKGLALQLGSDCPFFIANTPQFAAGRGEIMSPLNLDLSGYTIQLICPEIHVSTAAAFGMLTPGPAAFDLRSLPELPVKDWRDNIHNVFEVPVFKEYPQLRSIKEQLSNQGALYASMSGSGSAVYGIFPRGQKGKIVSELAFEEHLIGYAD